MIFDDNAKIIFVKSSYIPMLWVLICHRLNCDNCLGGVMRSVLMCIFNVD